MNNSITTIIEKSENCSDDIAKYSSLIDTYGASAVIIAVFIMVLLVMFIYILRSNQKTNNQLIQQQQKLVDTLLSNKKDDNENTPVQNPTIVKEPNIVQVFLDVNSSIKEILKYMSDEINTNRIAVYVFHNGAYSSHGLPFFKLSCVCEIIRKNCGVSKRINVHTNLPLQMFDENISCLYKNGKMSIVDVDNEEDEYVHDAPMLIGMFKNNNIKSATGVAIYDHDNNILGILLAEFVELKDKEFLDKVENFLIEKVSMLSPILEYSGIYDTTNK